MKTKQPLDKADLDRNEWCFKSIRKTELDACYAYEYLRELSRRPDQNSNGSANAAFRKFITPFIGNVAILRTCSPKIAWQDLDSKVRSEMVRGLAIRDFASLTMEPESETDITNIEKFRRAYRKMETSKFNLERTEYGFFAINWRYADREIKQRFAKWLSARRKEMDYKAKARGGSMDRLNWLGALRVLNHYRKTPLVDYYLQDSKLMVAAPYRYSSDLYKNAKKAGNLLEIFSELFDRS
jgi:hypothetical protein